MPKLPDVQSRGSGRRPTFDKKASAKYIAAYLNHTSVYDRSGRKRDLSGARMQSYFSTAIRRWLDENPWAREQFIKWYERQ